MNTLLIILSALSISFSHLSFKDGLTSGSVTDIYFDEKGIVWIATGNGLNSYDGNRVYNHPSKNNSVMRLAGDGRGTLFVASRGELYSIDLRSLKHTTISQDNTRAIAYYDSFLYVATGNVLKRYSKDEPLPETISVFDDSDNITALVISKEGTAWLGTEHGDIIRYNLNTGVSARWNAGSLVENLFLDSGDTLWAATFSSGAVVIGKDGESGRFMHEDGVTNSLASNFVRSICEDENGDIWMGTFSGLDHLNRTTGSFTHHTPDRIRPESLSNSSVWVIRKDRQGTLWAGTFFGGVNYFNPAYAIYRKYPVSSIDGLGLSSQIVRRIGIGDDGKIIVATEGGGFNILDPETYESVWYRKDGKNRISENNVKAFLFDRPHNCIWIGTHLGGLDRIDLKTGKSSPFRSKGKPGDDPDTDDVLCIEDAADSLLVGTTRGLYLFSKTTAEYRWVAGRNGISDIKRDGRGSVWFSSGELYNYDSVTKKTEVFLSGKSIISICCLSDGTLALGSQSAQGITLFDPVARSSSFVDMSGIWSEAERALNILESPASGRLLISSDRGFTTMDADGSNISYHCSDNGFPLDNTVEHAMMVTPEGVVYVGGLSGMISFRESDLSIEPRPYSLAFSKFVLDGAQTLNIPYETSLSVSPDVSSFSVEFLSSNHIAENKSTFEYKMTGLSKKWTGIWGSNSISFSNIPHGKYTLHVRPRGTPPSVCGEISIPITVRAAWYQTIAAKIIYLILILGAAVLGLRYLIRYLKSKEADRLAYLRQKDMEKFKTFEKATSIVYSNIDNSEFNIGDFASEMALSRSALFEKIKASTGFTPNEFILDIRLKESLKLLKNNPELNVSDISYKVGFSSPHYFSKCFKQRYKETPLTWRKKQSIPK